MEFVSKSPIHKGFSVDKKFRVRNRQGDEYLLRISPMECYQKRRQDYDYTLRFLPLGLPMCVPIEFGICDEGVYSLQKWIEGIDLLELLPSLSYGGQYTYGMETGRTLNRLHKLPVPEHLDSWESVFCQKAEEIIGRYQKSPVQFPKAQILINFIRENTHYVVGRPRVYLHGDYHVGNLMKGEDGKLYMIDFSSGICCDPWMDFGCIAVSASECPGFACGMIDGYFDGDIPAQFWMLLAVYTCCQILRFFTSSRRIQILSCRQKILSLSENMLHWYDNMHLAIPTWYRPVGNEAASCSESIPDSLLSRHRF